MKSIDFDNHSKVSSSSVNIKNNHSDIQLDLTRNLDQKIKISELIEGGGGGGADSSIKRGKINLSVYINDDEHKSYEIKQMNHGVIKNLKSSTNKPKIYNISTPQTKPILKQVDTILSKSDQIKDQVQQEVASNFNKSKTIW